jgi:hypothetical protein
MPVLVEEAMRMLIEACELSRRRGVWLLLALVITACAASDGATATLRTPEQVHDAWITALRGNNREQALVLAADIEFKTDTVDGSLAMIQREKDRITGDGATGGNLAAVRAIKMEERGAGRRAWSLWQYASRSICHQTDLTQTTQGWRVVDFNVTTEGCGP